MVCCYPQRVCHAVNPGLIDRSQESDWGPSWGHCDGLLFGVRSVKRLNTSMDTHREQHCRGFEESSGQGTRAEIPSYNSEGGSGFMQARGQAVLYSPVGGRDGQEVLHCKPQSSALL